VCAVHEVAMSMQCRRGPPRMSASRRSGAGEVGVHERARGTEEVRCRGEVGVHEHAVPRRSIEDGDDIRGHRGTLRRSSRSDT
jgi:hypothetical protein